MNGIILQWLQSEPISDVRSLDAAWQSNAILLSVAILLSGLFLLLCMLLRRRRRRAVPAKQPCMADGSITQELPVEAVQANLQTLHVLMDIVYCESEETIL